MTDDRPRPRYTVGPSIARYFKRNLRHHKGAKFGQPFVFDNWQQDDLDLIYEVDDQGRRVWTTVLWGIARGGGKSPVASGLGLLELESRRNNPEIVCLSGSADQAQKVLGPAKWNVDRAPLNRRLRALNKSVFPRGRPGQMKVLASDGSLLHGGGADVGIIDEWHAFTTQKQREAYTAVATSLHKTPRSIELAITTAGFDLHSQLGERYSKMLKLPDLYVSADGCTTIARDPSTRMLMIWRGAPADAPADDPAIWRACNPASFLDMEEMRIQQGKLPEGIFRRLHLNQWTLGEKAIWPAGAWQRLARAGLTLPPGTPVYLGVDIGLKKDSSAVAVVWRNTDGQLCTKVEIWQPEGDGSMLDLNIPVQYIQSLALTNPIMEVAYDPRFFVGHAQILSDAGFMMVEAPQSPERMAPASQRFFDMVVSGEGPLHDGDPVLTKHVASMGTTPVGDSSWRFTKRKSTDTIDGGMAEVFAIDRAANTGAQPWAVIP